jgi:hypothetical protein
MAEAYGMRCAGGRSPVAARWPGCGGCPARAASPTGPARPHMCMFTCWGVRLWLCPQRLGTSDLLV